MLRRLFLFCFLFFACQAEPAQKINDKDIFFNNTIVDGILDVEEAGRDEHLKQYLGNRITGRAKVVSVHETLATEDAASYGKLEVLAIAKDVVPNQADVEYRLYVTPNESQDLTHKVIDIAFTGVVKRAQWIKEGNNRALRVYVVVEQIEPRN